MLRLTECGLHQKSRYLNWPRYQTLMNFQRRLPNITKLVRRSFRPFGPDVARSRNCISEGHKSRKIGTGKIVGVKKKRSNGATGRGKVDIRLKFSSLFLILPPFLALCTLVDECGPKE